MFGIRYIKFPPTTHVIHFAGGRIKHQGAGLGFTYFAPTSTLVAVPVQSLEAPFMFSQVTADFQEVTVQGMLTFRIAEPELIAKQLDYTLRADGRGYATDEPEKLFQRLTNLARVTLQRELKARNLREALASVDELPDLALPQLAENAEVAALGIEVMGLALLAIKPTPETARALEAEAREQILQEADDAVYVRRNASVEQERKVRENELNTEIAVENKRRQIEEAKMEAKKALQARNHELEEARTRFAIEQEGERQKLVELQSANAREEADARAYGIEAAMKVFANVDPRVLQALALHGMQPDQIIAAAFQNLAGNAERIGELNISPDLLNRLVRGGDYA